MFKKWQPGVNQINSTKLHELPQDERNDLRIIITRQGLTRTLKNMQTSIDVVDLMIFKMIHK